MANREDWTPLHHLAYVYAAIASSDGSISSDELEVLSGKLHQWNTDIDAGELMEIVMTAVSTLGRDKVQENGDNLPASILVVADAIEPASRVAALDDLVSIAGADGKFKGDEGKLLLEIKAAWETYHGGLGPQRDIRHSKPN